MRYDRLYDCICILILSLLFEILLLLPSVCHTKITNDTSRIKLSSVSVRNTLIPNNRNVNYATKIREVVSLVSVNNDSAAIAKDDVYRNKKYKISKQSVQDSPQEAIITDFLDYDDVPTCPGSRCLNEKTDHASKTNESLVRLEQNRYKGTNDLVRIRRDVNADLDRYTEQDEGSSLYDDYEAKDIAKRGAMDGPEDYEEVDEEEEDSPSVLEDMLAVQEEGSMLDEVPRREAQNDVRVKRYQTVTAERTGIAEITGKSSKRDVLLNKQEVNSMVDHSKRNLQEGKREVNLKSVNEEGDSELSSSSNNEARFENDGKSRGDDESPLNTNNNPRMSSYSTNLTEPSYSFDISKIVISKSIDNTKLNPNILFKIDGTEIAASDPIELRMEEKPKTVQENSHYLCESPHKESFEDINVLSSGMSEIQGSDSKKRIAKLRDASKIVESTNAVSSKNDRSINTGYENRVEEEIQRKIDSIKEEIKRDIEIQQRIRDIEDNNARFDELQDQERDNVEEGQNSNDKLIEKRQNTAKRSIQAVTDNVAISSTDNNSKQVLRKRENEKPQRRSNEIAKSKTPRARHSPRESVKRQSVVDYNHSPETALSQGSLKKKRENARQTILVNNNRYHGDKKKRQSRSYVLPSEARDNDKLNEGGLSLNQDKSSYLHADNGKMIPLAAINENYGYDEGSENAAAAGEVSHSLVPVSQSSRELSPRLAREYKEAFGGLQQNEPGSALARFKRIKRVLRVSSD